MDKRTFLRAFAFLCVLLLLAAGSAGPAGASLSLDRAVIEFKLADRPVETINVTNTADKPTKVSVATVEVLNSGQKGEVEKETDKLVVAPKAFEMQPGETKAVRLVLRDRPADLEAIYRIRFKPSEVSFTQEQKTEGKTIHLSIIMSMGALIIVAPKNSTPDLQFVRDGKTIHFTNKGNVTATLQREDICTDNKKSCSQIPSLRIYPGETTDMELPPELAGIDVSQTVLINGGYSKLFYPLTK
jgi:P pilus assembly chaperone PapD